MKNTSVAVLAAACAVLLPGASEAQQVSLLAGGISSRSDWPDSYAWSFSYRDQWSFAPHFSTTVAYLNQGHFPGHHRDGVTAEAWGQLDFLRDHLTFAIGAGPFRYYDTVSAAGGGTRYSDFHGWAWIYSADLTWQPRQTGWFAELRADRTSPAKSIETTSITLGGGYRFVQDLRSTTEAGDGSSNDNEATVFYGKTVVNSLNSQESAAKAVEFRRRFYDRLRASAAFINEGDPQLIRRSGLVAEGWLEPSFSGDRFSVGVGAGVYAAIDKYRATPGRHLSGIVTLTLSARLVDHLDARFNWHRIVTNYDRDTDVVLGGLGFRF